MIRSSFLACLALFVSIDSVRAQFQQEPIVPILTGQVIDQQGQPILAHVHVLQADRNVRAASVRTDPNGWFEAAGWATSPVEVRVTAEGYTSERLEIQLPATWPPLVFRLRRSAIVTGSVLDGFGLPVAGAKVAVVEVSIQRKWVSTNLADVVVFSMPDGNYAIGVPAGRPFRLKIEKDGCKAMFTDYMTMSEAQHFALAGSTVDCRF